MSTKGVFGRGYGPKPKEFWSQVAFDDSGCWEWQGTRFGSGYGRAMDGRKAVGAHRRAWELVYGPIPDGLLVMHACDNKPCVRIDHLALGTPAQNMADMVGKGRSLTGELNHWSKLNPQAIRDIRAALLRGETKAALARRYEVSEQTVRCVAQGKTWSSVK